MNSVSPTWPEAGSSAKRQAAARLQRAVRRNSPFSRAGIAERVFARVFSGLVYAQIWEDPDVDMEALAIEPGNSIVTIASGGCNALSYLLADPARIEAVDLNRTHVAFNRLKLAALAALPDHDSFFRFYGGGAGAGNESLYHAHIRQHLDAETRAYWEGRRLSGRRRISIFSRGLYRHGLLGLFIGAGHRAARLYGIDPRQLLAAKSVEEQRAFFDKSLAPLFDRKLVRWVTDRKSSLYGLGIPPQQYDELATSGSGMAAILRERLEKLACDFPLSENYFAWQAFGRRYDESGPLPPYLKRENHETVRSRVDRLTVVNASFGEFLSRKPEASVDRFILLDAQDWMTEAQLNDMWLEITRTAAPGARVIFRTAAAGSILTGRLMDSLAERWDYRETQSRALHARDRSSIYGGFHLYVLKG